MVPVVSFERGHEVGIYPVDVDFERYKDVLRRIQPDSAPMMKHFEWVLYFHPLLSYW